MEVALFLYTRIYLLLNLDFGLLNCPYRASGLLLALAQNCLWSLNRVLPSPIKTAYANHHAG